MVKKILIIKLGAKGDVVRTLPILHGIKEKYPDSEISWIVKEKNAELIQSPFIDKIYFSENFNTENKTFDILYNFDIEEEATNLAENIKADKKYGFYLEQGFASCFNLSSEYYLNTLFDDDTKKNNKKTYQEMMFEVAELPYSKQHHKIYLNNKDMEYAENFIQENNLNAEKLIGIHMGAGPRWPSKEWAEEKLEEFIIIAKNKGYEILLFGGPDEIEQHKTFSDKLKQQNIKIYQSNPKNTDKEFAALVNICKVMICSDSLALHVSIALKKPTIALFFCTPPDEVENSGLVKKIVSPLLYDFFPQKMDQFNKELVNSISAQEVLDAVEDSLNKNL
jgi:heptosyltransferase-2